MSSSHYYAYLNNNYYSSSCKEMDFDPECFSPTVQQEITQQGFELFNMPFSL